MGYSTVNPDKVGFSKGTRVLIGPVGASKGDCIPVGLLGADATLSMEKTFRTKNDHFPEVEVASAVQTLTMTGNIVLREWTKENLRYALDVAAGDVTEVLADPVNVEGEAHTLDANGVATLKHPGATSVAVTGSVLGTDYVTATVAGFTRVIALAGGNLSPNDEITVDYTHTPVAHTEMPLGSSGPRNYYGVWFEEELTISPTARVEYQIYRAAIGLDGSFNLNNAESGADLPVVIQASLQPGQTALGRLYNYE